jgi:hypothetical protein
LSGTGVLARITAQEERIEVEAQEAGGLILATPLRILNPSIVSAGMEAKQFHAVNDSVPARP